MNLNAITEEHLVAASNHDDIEVAALELRKIAGIPCDRVAILRFGDEAWPGLTKSQRTNKLRRWVETEKIIEDLDAAPVLSPIQALRAIIARINGEWDQPDLKQFGPLHHDTQEDILAIALASLGEKP